MNVLLCGHNNLIGKYLIKIFEEEEIKHSYSYYDTKSNDIQIEILQEKYSHVVYCENYFNNGKTDDFEKEMDLNLYSPIKLAFFCQLYKIHFTYIGNGNIYNFEENLKKIFNEEDEPNFKPDKRRNILCYTDRLLKFTDSLNLRVPNLITESLKDKYNYIRKIFFKTKVNEINVSVSLLRDIAPIIVELLKNRDKGTFNLCNEGTVTENQILQLYKKYIIKKFKWKVEKDLRDKGECYSVFDTTLISLKKYELPNALESIEKFLSNYDKSIEE